MQEDLTKEYGRIIERKVINLYMIFALLMLITELGIKKNVESIMWTFPEVVTCWVVYLIQYKDKRFRAYLITCMALISFLGYGIRADSLFAILPSFGVLLILTGLFNMPQLLGMVSVVVLILTGYHAFVIQTFDYSGPDDFLNVLQYLMSIFLMIYLVYFLIKKDTKMNDRLLYTIEILRQTEHSKDEFMANVSHEIRTPLNTVCGMSELSLREELPNQVRQNLFDIQIAGRNLQTIVSDVLDFSELETGKLTIAEETYNFTSILNDVLNVAIAQNEEKNLELVVNCDVDIPCGMVGDSEKIRRIFSCFVNNAVKFTHNGCVVISASARKEEYGVNLCINVKDTGIGISPEGIERLFTSFNQIDTKKNRKQSGMGLGLAISHKMVDMMNGFISVKSEEGKGSEFQFVIPQKVEDDKPIIELKDKESVRLICYINQEKYGMAEIRDSYMSCIKNIARQLEIDFTQCQSLMELKRRLARRNYSYMFITVDEYKEDPEFFERLSGEMSVILGLNRNEDIEVGNNFMRIYKPFYVLSLVAILNGENTIQRMDGSHYLNRNFVAPDASVLVVDDNIMNLKVMEGLLRPYEMKFYTAGSGSEALMMLDRMYFDLVFMDHMMPGMDGVETLHKMRAKSGKFYQSVPVVAFTANAIGGAREMFLSEGFQDFVAKPVEVSTLERVLKKFISPDKIHIKKGSSIKQEVGNKKNGSFVIKEAEISELGDETEFIDVKTGINYSGGNFDDYIDVIRLYYTSGVTKKEQIQKLFADKNWSDYTIMVHALKSTSLGIGAKDLSEMAKEQEKAGKNGDVEYIMSHHESLMDYYGKVLDAISNNKRFFPDGVKKPEPKSISENIEKSDNENAGGRKFAEIDRDTLNERLDSLAERLDSFEEETVIPIINELSEYTYNGTSLDVKLKEVAEQVSSFDFCGAMETLEELRKEWEDE